MIIFGSARHDENGNYYGKVGDQKQVINADGYDMSGEVSTQEFYVNKLGWIILRAKDPRLANGLAFSMALACVNKNIGYSMSISGSDSRLGIVENGILTDTPVNADCGTTVRACLKNCGHNIGNFSTANEVDVLMATGLFDRFDFKAKESLCNGDILVTKTKGHTGIIVSGAQDRLKTTQVCPYPEPMSLLKMGDSGDEVKWVQFYLKKQGATIEIDGIFGRKTDMWVRAFQNSHNITVDGIVGNVTKKYLKIRWS